MPAGHFLKDTFIGPTVPFNLYADIQSGCAYLLLGQRRQYFVSLLYIRLYIVFGTMMSGPGRMDDIGVKCTIKKLQFRARSGGKAYLFGQDAAADTIWRGDREQNASATDCRGGVRRSNRIRQLVQGRPA